MTPFLTIVIPTFERNDLLRTHVAALLPQLTSEVRLVILDNASRVSAQETLGDLVSQYPGADVRIVRHRVNIGSSGNVMRCMEVCETPWLWILGDDDRPLPNAVAVALETCRSHDDHLLVSFNGMHRAVERELHTDGLSDFIRSIPNFSNLTLISCNLLHVDRISAHLRMGYFYAYSLYPYLACVLATLYADGGKCCFSPNQLIEWGERSEWSRVLAAKGIGIILDLPMSAADRRHLARLLNQVSGRYTSLAIHLLDQIDVTMDAATARHVYSQAWHRLFRFDPSPLRHVRRFAGYVMLRFPSLGRAFYRKYRQLRGYPAPNPPKDEMGRT